MRTDPTCASNRTTAKRGAWSFAFLTAFMLVALVSLLAKEFVMPRAEDARTYTARDNHPNEHVAVGADPYIDEKASLFKTKFADYDILPVFVVITNYGDQPVELSRSKFELVTVNRRARIEPATEDDLYRRLSKVSRRGDEPSRNPLPIPLPGRGPKVGVKKELRQEIESSQFRARAIDANSTESGFLFFDVRGIRDPLAGGKLYVTSVRNSDGQELMFFEVPLDAGQNK
jgi:hypothetical protein